MNSTSKVIQICCIWVSFSAWQNWLSLYATGSKPIPTFLFSNSTLSVLVQSPLSRFCSSHPHPPLLKALSQSAFYSYNCCIIFFEDIFQPALLLRLKLNFRNAETEFQNNWSKGYKSRSTFIWANGAPMDFVTNQLIAMRAKLWFTIRGKQREAQLLHALFGKCLLMISTMYTQPNLSAALCASSAGQLHPCAWCGVKGHASASLTRACEYLSKEGGRQAGILALVVTVTVTEGEAQGRHLSGARLHQLHLDQSSSGFQTCVFFLFVQQYTTFGLLLYQSIGKEKAISELRLTQRLLHILKAWGSETPAEHDSSTTTAAFCLGQGLLGGLVEGQEYRILPLAFSRPCEHWCVAVPSQLAAAWPCFPACPPAPGHATQPLPCKKLKSPFPILGVQQGCSPRCSWCPFYAQIRGHCRSAYEASQIRLCTSSSNIQTQQCGFCIQPTGSEFISPMQTALHCLPVN